jgi:excisionase family DNA binding protein
MLDPMSIPSGPREGALPIAEAARRLGVSTLRVRQYVAEGRLDAIRDNRGRLRVELGPDGPRPPRGAAVSPVELLMEELIDLREDSAEREVQVERLERLVGELSGLLGRALDALATAKDEAAEDRAHAAAVGEQTRRALALAARAMDAASRGRG